MDVKIEKGTVVTVDGEGRVLKDHSLAVEDGRIVEISRRVAGEAEHVIDARGKIVMPGLVNTHTHLAMTLMRGVADDLPLMKWLQEEIWPLEANLEPRHIYAGSLLGCLEMLMGGTTTFNDMYFQLDEVARAVEESGIRGVLSHAMFDLVAETSVEEAMREGRAKVRKYNSRPGRVRVFFGPHAPYTCSEELLVAAKEEAERLGTGLHIHVSETRQEVEDSRREKGLAPIEYLEKIGFLGPEVVAAHCVWPKEREFEVLRERGVKVSHNPISNMKIAAGIAPVPEYLNKGIQVSLATDGAASNNTLDMFETMKMTALLHKVTSGDASAVPAGTVLEMATAGGARALGMEEIGSLEVGKRADIVLVNTKVPNLTPFTNPVSHLVYAARSSDVDTVMVDGRILMEGRRVRSLDPGAVLELAARETEHLLEKGGKLERLT
ncbi:MAG: amidohydrolase family protein [Euryarchaeota archaeon]|nr:amidohydrolase family protein [Euryarchaeota archaeon]